MEKTPKSLTSRLRISMSVVALISAFGLGWHMRSRFESQIFEQGPSSQEFQQPCDYEASSSGRGAELPLAATTISSDAVDDLDVKCQDHPEQNSSDRWDLLREIWHLSRGDESQKLGAAELLLSLEGGKCPVPLDLAGAIRVQEEAFIEWLLMQSDNRLRKLKIEAARYLHASACRIDVDYIAQAAAAETSAEVCDALLNELYARRNNASIDFLIDVLRNHPDERSLVRKVLTYLAERLRRNPKEILSGYSGFSSLIVSSETRIADSRFSCKTRGVLLGDSDRTRLPEMLESGDLVVLIDGIPPRGIADLGAACRRAESERRCVMLDLWRNGALIMVSCPADGLDEFECWYVIPR
ncbi:MAG: hypothetical protein HYY18_09330 [Planctomycetes bacterium]|nr:hypothetical protein [Planctomycetota bacterium]